MPDDKLPRPLCRFCGKPIPKRTVTVQFGASGERTSAGGYWRERPERPATREEAQRFVNEALTGVRYGGEPRRVTVAYAWDGESFMDPFFCKNICAQSLGYIAARSGYGADAYLKALEAADAQ